MTNYTWGVFMVVKMNRCRIRINTNKEKPLERGVIIMMGVQAKLRPILELEVPRENGYDGMNEVGDRARNTYSKR